MRPRPLLLAAPVAALAWAWAWAFASAAPAPREDEGARAGERFLQAYCLRCHSAAQQEGGLVLEDPARVDAETWALALRRVQQGKMPPPDEPVPRPKPDEVQAFAAFVGARAHAAPAPVASARPALRRLNRLEYDNSVRDLLGVHSRPAEAFPDDDVANGFDTASAALSLPPPLLERYLQAAEQVAREAVLVFEPVRARQAAKALATKGRVHDDRGDFRKVVTNGSFTGRFAVPYAGKYRVRARCYGDQAGPDKVRLGLLIDSNRAALRELAGEEEQEVVFEVELARGRRRVELAFLNDYWEPNDPDPGNRDRNFALAWLELEGPLQAPPLPEAHRALLAGEAELRWDRLPKVVGELAARAFRRPVRADELERLLGLVAQARAQGRPPERALRLALTAILVSPGFLFRTDLDAGREDLPRAPLDDWALAARLSYFLWSSLPDAGLRALAAKGELRPALAREAARLLDDPRSAALVESFGGQWLHLRVLDEVTPDAGAFPAFDAELREAMRAETELFLEALLREDRPVRELLDARFSFVNEPLAKLYGIPGVRGRRFRRVNLPPERGGVLTHASVLTLTSNPTGTSPVKRGRWVLEALLDDPPPPPPPGADSLSEAVKARKDLTPRQRLELHRTRESCRACHGRLDPLGFALERFDAIGARRADAALVDASGVLPDGTRLDDARGLRTALLARAPQVSAGLARKLLVYALGRPLTRAERAEVDALAARLGPEVGLKRLVLALLQTQAFLTRAREETP
ncbi:MAG: DUF1592 domain-containing protein [Planctomycetota bacterium]